MRKKMKRCLGLFLSFVMILSLCPATILAEETTSDADSNAVASYDIEESTNEAKPTEDNTYMATKIEAESAALTLPAIVEASSTASRKYKAGEINNQNATVTFELSVAKTGTYVVEVVADGQPGNYPDPGHNYWVNGDIDNKKTVSYTQATMWNEWDSYFIQVELNAGENTLTFSKNDVKNSYAEIDYIVLYQDIDATKEKINIAFDLDYKAEINIKDDKVISGYAEAIFEGTGGQGSLITFNGTEITLGTQKIEEVASNGVYHVNADIDHAQQMLMVTLTMPNGTEVQRGHFGFLNNTTNVDKISIDAFGTVKNVEITYPEPAKNTADVPTAETTAFDSEAYNLVTSIIGDARTTRGFAWTAKTDHTDMVIEYAKAGADFETTKKQEPAQYDSKDGLLYYEVDVEDLEPGTKYAYRIGDRGDNIWSSTYFFTTEAEDVTDFSFVAITDTQRDEDFKYLRKTVATAMPEGEDAAFLVNVGDIVHDGTKESQWKNYFEKLKGYLEDVPHVPVAGNHDYDYATDTSGGELFGLHFNNPDNGGKEAIGSLTEADLTTQKNKNVIKNIKDTIYSFDYGNAHFAVLNSGAYQGGSADDLREDPIAIIEAQKAWLRNDLNKSNKQWKVVIVHQGVYDSYTWCDSPITDVVEECGVDLVISGHTHDYSRSYPMKGEEISCKTNQDMLTKGGGAIYQVIGNVTNNYKDFTALEVPAELYTYSNSAVSEPTYTVYDFSETELRVVTKQLDGYVVDSFAISDETVKNNYKESVDKAADEYNLGDISAVVSPLTLAEKYGDVSISWTTSDASVVDIDGSIRRSASGNKTATLTATFSRKGTSHTRIVEYQVTVLQRVDTTALLTAVMAGEEKLTRPLSHLYYEEEGWESYIAAIKEGGRVLFNPEVAQQVVDGALEKIEEAETALKEIHYTLNVTDGVICGKDGEEDVTTATYTAMQETTIKADPTNDGKVFSYWAYDEEGTQIASYGRAFKFFMIKDVNLYAIYKPEVEVEDDVSVTANAVYDAELDKVVVTIRRTAPLECVIVEHGILVTKDGNVALKVENVGDIVKGVKKTDENGLPVDGLAIVRVNLASGESCYACGYVIYIDADGKYVTKYSEIVNAGKPSEDTDVEEGTGIGDETNWPI